MAAIWRGRALNRKTSLPAPGLTPKGSVPNPAAQMDTWQRAGDERMWKVIISPEFGERVDLQKLTCDLMERIAGAQNGALEWIAVAHFNTEHPHVHVALRGVNRDGQAVRFPKEFIKNGIRQLAENLCTQQLGYRTEFDAAAAERREVEQLRFTSLDRTISRTGVPAENGTSMYLRVMVADPRGPAVGNGARLRNQHLIERLIALQRMGLAEPAGATEWRVRQGFENVLRGIQCVADRQRVLTVHGTPLSDERLPIEVMEGRDWKILEGRVLVHGEEDGGRSYLMLEGTDARVRHVYYTPEIEEARSRGQMRTNSFVRLRRNIVAGAFRIRVEDLGDAESIIRNKTYLRATARRLVQQGIATDENSWGGWLGRFQAALHQTAVELEQASSRETSRPHDRGDSRGR